MKNKKGFTLIELLVVVLIIGILSAVALPQYEKAVEKSRMAEAFVMLNAIAKGMNLYELQHDTPVSPTLTTFYSLEDALAAAGMECPNGSCNTKNFTYATLNGNLESIECGTNAASASRIGKDYTLCYHLNSSGFTKSCVYSGSAAQKICQSLGSDWTVRTTSQVQSPI